MWFERRSGSVVRDTHDFVSRPFPDLCVRGLVRMVWDTHHFETEVNQLRHQDVCNLRRKILLLNEQ